MDEDTKSRLVEGNEFATNVGQGDHKSSSLKSSLKAWREVIVWTYRLLLWEKPFYPAITFGLITLKYLLIWYMDPSVVTCLSLAVMTICILDFAMPLASPMIFPETNWTTEKESKYKEACDDIKKARAAISSLIKSFTSLKDRNPWLYMAAITVTLSTLAWLGNQMHNLLLAYFFALIVTAIPGLIHHGMFDKLIEKINKIAKKRK